MKGRADPIAVVEASYALDADDTDWLREIAEAGRPLVESPRGAMGFIYDLHDETATWMRSFISIDMDPQTHVYVRAAYEALTPEFRRRLLAGNPPVLSVSGALTQGRPLEEHDSAPIRETSRFGWSDGLAVCDRDTSGLGCLVAFPLPSVRGPVSRREMQVWGRLLAHMVAGLRLRRDLVGLRPPSTESGSEAVLDPNGRVHHAEDRAAPRSVRDSLREAVRSRERARGPLRRTDAEAAVEIWKALVVGRWSLVDRFDSDGRRFIVALPNAPRSRDPRGLTEREEAVAELLALGHSNKRIAYALGVSEGAVASLVHRALRKLGLRSRASLAEFLCAGQSAEAAIPVTPSTRAPVALVARDMRPRAALTPRQREIVARVAAGATNREIAGALACSPYTIANTMRALFRKAGVGSRTELVRWALGPGGASCA